MRGCHEFFWDNSASPSYSFQIRHSNVFINVYSSWWCFLSSPHELLGAPVPPLLQRLFVWNHYNSPARLLSSSPLGNVHTSQFRPLGKTELDTYFFMFLSFSLKEYLSIIAHSSIFIAHIKVRTIIFSLFRIKNTV